MKKKNVLLLFLVFSTLLIFSCKKSTTPSWARGKWEADLYITKIEMEVKKDEVILKEPLSGETESLKNGKDGCSFTYDDNTFTIKEGDGEVTVFKKKDAKTITADVEYFGEMEFKKI